MPPNPTPTPARRWAVYTPPGYLCDWTLRELKRESIEAIVGECRGAWPGMQESGYTCRRVVVTAEEGE